MLESKFGKIRENLKGKVIKNLVTKQEIYAIYAKERNISLQQARLEWICVEETINKCLLNKKPNLSLGVLTLMRKPAIKKVINLKPSKNKTLDEFYIKPYRYAVKVKPSILKSFMEHIKKIVEKEESTSE